MSSAFLFLSIFNRHIAIHCSDPFVQSLLRTGYGHMLSVAVDDPDLQFKVGQFSQAGGFFIDRDGERIESETSYDFLYDFEKDLTIALQHKRSDLYFIHAAAVEWSGVAAILVAPSGTGKSTTTFGLLHEGFRYLSDELAPVDLETLAVQPYPHALCLKSPPPPPYALPMTTLRTGVTLHLPVSDLPATTCDTAIPLGAIFFLSREEASNTYVVRIDAAEASVRLYSNALNNLAHAGEGLDAAIQLSSKIPCFRLQLGELTQVGKAIRTVLADLKNMTCLTHSGL